MARRSTLAGPWSALLQSAGGVAQLAKELDISTARLFRVSRGLVPPDAELAERVHVFAKSKKLPSPFGAAPAKKSAVDNVDMDILRYFGVALDMGEQPSKEFLERMAKRFGDKLLIGIAEDESITDKDIHLSVSTLLGL